MEKLDELPVLGQSVGNINFDHLETLQHVLRIIQPHVGETPQPIMGSFDFNDPLLLYNDLSSRHQDRQMD